MYRPLELRRDLSSDSGLRGPKLVLVIRGELGGGGGSGGVGIYYKSARDSKSLSDNEDTGGI
jgi:hypothetical protein